MQEKRKYLFNIRAEPSTSPKGYSFMAIQKTWRVLTILLPLALLLFSCGGGGSTSSVTGQATAFTVVEKVSVVDAQAGGGGQPASAAPARRAGPTPLALPTAPNSGF